MNPNFQFGYSVSSNGDGTIIAVGAWNAAYESGNGSDGQVTVYKYVKIVLGHRLVIILMD